MKSLAMYPMLFLSGATLPLNVLPNFLQTLAQFIPLTYVVNLLRDGWNGTFFTSAAIVDITILFGCLIISSGIGIKYFRWTN